MSHGSWFKGARKRSGAGGRDQVGRREDWGEDEVADDDGAGGENRPDWAGGDGVASGASRA
jgi:hypothetical protein